jgi:hypothetical protein
MLGAFTFGDVIWSMLIFFACIMFITWVILLMIDNFRRTDHSGWAKALWALFIIFFPIIGAFTYTIARPDAAGDYYDTNQSSSESTSPAEELTRLNELRHQGAISDAEYEDLKAKTIATS